MKKILLFSFFILATQSLTSCTADAIPENVPQTVNAEDTGGQSGLLTPPPPPKP